MGARQVTTTDIWTATLTTAEPIVGFVGCTTNCGTALSDNTFTYDSTDYTITSLYLLTSNRTLTLIVDTDITTTTNGLTLVVGSTSFLFADTDTTTSTIRSWDSTSLSWTAGTDVNVKHTATNNAPTVANAIPNQSATVGTAFSYMYRANTFNDTDTGDTLTYTTTKADGAVLPTWLMFDAGTRTFSGTPTAAETFSVKVTASDGTASVSDEFDITVNATIPEVPANWSLKPSGLPNGAQFRLLFLSSTKRTASSTDIATYNTFVQTRAAAGHTDIQSYSSGFRAVGCTAAVDARDNTLTTGTGFPIYWLNGAKVADDYADFYDGSWDDEANDKNESGTNGPDTSEQANYPFTGCAHNGTEASFGGISYALGTSNTLGAAVGRPNSPMAVNGPLGSDDNALNTSTRPMYGLSQVFQVEAGPSLTSAVVNETGQTIQLVFSADLQSSHLPPASAFSVIADGTEVMISAVAAGITPDIFEITVSPPIRPSQTVVFTYEDPTGGDDANAIQDTAGIDTPDFTTGMNGVPDVINNALSEVPANWSLKPTSLNAGDKFRLLFLSSTKRNATVTAIATYNTFIQNRAAAGHSDIRAYSAGFRVVGCTAAVDARDNTLTTYISTDKGVPIYWLNGTKVADQYEDFYDESWDDEVKRQERIRHRRSRYLP